MGEYAIKAQFEVARPPQEVKRWLDKPEGIAGWWSDKVDGAASAPGDRFHVTFPTSPVVFDLDVISASDQLVEWRIDKNPPWWQGTTIRFELSENEDGQTRMLFIHQGFSPDDPIIQAITPAWVRFLDNLVTVAESGKPNPAVVN
jgi:glutaminase